ncbi:MAG: YgiT-type zinc finger protein [Chloroflexi bacterium]|nr:YgiT-type zinc finger protein [Chloroflexota bacterium]
MGPKTSSTKHACPRCQIGTMQPTQASYSTVYRSALLSVPNIPAWSCDICAYLEYDDDAMARLEALVGEYILTNETARANPKPAALDSEGEPGEGKRSTRVKP